MDYDFPAQPLNLPTGPSSATLATRGLAAATQAQAGLPDGFALLPGQTTIIAIQNPSASASARTPAATGAAANSSALMEKFITLQPIAYQGIPLSKGSDYTTVVGGDNRLLVVRRRGLPASVDATTPSVSALDAVAAARQVAGQAFTGLDPQKINPALEIWVDDQQAGHLSWTFSLSTGSLTDPDVRRFWMSARDTPRVLNWESEIFHTHHGQVTGNIWTTSPQPPPPTTATANRPLADLRVIRNTDNATQVTGPDGLYGYTTGSGSAQITAQLLGSYATVQNQAGPGLQSAKTGDTTNPGHAMWPLQGSISISARRQKQTWRKPPASTGRAMSTSLRNQCLVLQHLLRYP